MCVRVCVCVGGIGNRECGILGGGGVMSEILCKVSERNETGEWI